MFTRKLVNRKTMPTRHILVCEDCLDCQAAIAERLYKLFGREGHVQVSFVPGAEMAAAIILAGLPVDAILLDHDMPYGDGTELLAGLKRIGILDKIKVITFSGIRRNNEWMLSQGAHVYLMKDEVINGAADEILRETCKEI